CAAGLWSIPAVLLLPAPAPESWRFIAQSTLIHLFYFSFVGLAYARVDLSVAYPLMRGLPPLATTAIAIVWLGEAVSLLALAGVALVSAGVMALLAESSRSGALDRRALAVVAVVAATVVAYTLNDALGARASGHAGSYLAWLLLLIAPGMLAVGLATRGPALLLETARSTWKIALLGGACTAISYGITLWAMKHAPVSLVAALREVSVILALLIAALALRERFGWVRIVSVGMVCAGAIAIKGG
ncbi:MAG: DMT family transporter, partial [Burkholderiales bacterium]|nr:DMT family transporter [Burkholderiales bacterium]